MVTDTLDVLPAYIQIQPNRVSQIAWFPIVCVPNLVIFFVKANYLPSKEVVHQNTAHHGIKIIP
jgi:hypothetical protein